MTVITDPEILKQMQEKVNSVRRHAEGHASSSSSATQTVPTTEDIGIQVVVTVDTGLQTSDTEESETVMAGKNIEETVHPEHVEETVHPDVPHETTDKEIVQYLVKHIGGTTTRKEGSRKRSQQATFTAADRDIMANLLQGCLQSGITTYAKKNRWTCCGCEATICGVENVYNHVKGCFAEHKVEIFENANKFITARKATKL